MQIGIFDGTQRFVLDKPIRLISLFSGYDSQALALKYLGLDFEHYKTCEWAVKSIQALKDLHFAEDNTDYSKPYTRDVLIDILEELGISANYNEPMTKEQIKRVPEDKLRQIYNNIQATHNLVNIQQANGYDFEIVDTDRYTYVMTYSFPCQDLSSAGLGKGMEKGSGTRSGMLWEVERILDELNRGGQERLPQVLLMENVPEVIGTNNIKHFAKWLDKLESLGYKCYWQVLNGKDYGVPQNRERCFMVSLLGDYYYNFPPIQKLTIKLKDILEENVDEKYFIKGKFLKHIKSTLKIGTNFDSFDRYNGELEMWCRVWKDIAPTLNTKAKYTKIYNQKDKIRTLTPKECFRLMGVRDADFDKVAQNQSNASLYHLAGDSIIVDVLMAIFKNMT